MLTLSFSWGQIGCTNWNIYLVSSDSLASFRLPMLGASASFVSVVALSLAILALTIHNSSNTNLTLRRSFPAGLTRSPASRAWYICCDLPILRTCS